MARLSYAYMSMYTTCTFTHTQARAEAVKMVRLLIKHGADVNARDANGRAPVHQAVGAGLQDMVRVCVHMRAHARTRRYTHACICMRVCMHTYMYIRAHVHTHAHVRVCIHAHVHTCMHTCTCTCRYAYMYTHMHMYVQVGLLLERGADPTMGSKATGMANTALHQV